MAETVPIEQPPEAEPAEPELTEEERQRRAEALAQVRTFGDPVLKSRASEITDFGPELGR